MARNKVQFQKGMSEAQFDALYGTEELCHDALVGWRWPDGFECPDCGGRAHCIVKRGGRNLYQCMLRFVVDNINHLENKKRTRYPLAEADKTT